MDREIEASIKRSPDYSESFTSVVRDIRRILECELRVSIVHCEDMNYSAAQTLTIFFDDKLQPLGHDCNPGSYKLVILLSSKGFFFTIICYQRDISKQQLVWHLLTNEHVPSIVLRVGVQASTILNRIGWRQLTKPQLEEVVEGYYTEMDGAPASVFQLLFSELV